MANIKSQKKRILITREENAANNSKRTRVKNIVKKYEALIAANDIAGAKALLPEVVSVIDKSGVFKDNTASRKVARLSKLLSDLEKAAVAE